MARFVGVATGILLAVLWLPVNVIADEGGNAGKSTAGTEAKQTGTGSGSGAMSSDKTAKKPDQKDVRSRGLFAKKKKKQVGGAAGHSQEMEQADQSSDADKVQERSVKPNIHR